MITGLHHVSMKCGTEAEKQRVMDFYVRVLGFRLVRAWPEGVMLGCGGALLEVFTDGCGIREKGALRHLALATDDVDEAARRVREAGYEVFIEPRELVIPADPVYRARIAFCRGPLGEELELFQEQPG